MFSRAQKDSAAETVQFIGKKVLRSAVMNTIGLPAMPLNIGYAIGSKIIGKKMSRDHAKAVEDAPLVLNIRVLEGQGIPDKSKIGSQTLFATLAIEGRDSRGNYLPGYTSKTDAVFRAGTDPVWGDEEDHTLVLPEGYAGMLEVTVLDDSGMDGFVMSRVVKDKAKGFAFIEVQNLVPGQPAEVVAALGDKDGHPAGIITLVLELEVRLTKALIQDIEKVKSSF